MVRTKLVAILLGPSGVGLVGLYVSATGLIGTFSGLGIGSSGVREVAEAHGSSDAEHIARTVRTLRRACWITGLLGWILTVALSRLLSLWSFGSDQRTWAIALLGVTLLLSSISGGQTALLQGTRRIGELARINVISVLLSTAVAVGLYAWLGESGIVPVLIMTACINLACSWWFARMIQVAPVVLPWAESWHHSKCLVGLGLAFMWGALLSAAVGLAIRSLILRKLGLEANGIYQAAWGISGMFAGFILSAMGTDFYPRLTAAAQDNGQVNRLVNEQTEIGILLALPGLMGSLAFAPWIMHMFYSAKFLAGAALLPWFVLGIFGQVISWPMGYIAIAKGAKWWLVLSSASFNFIQLLFVNLFLKRFGLCGISFAFALMYAIHVVGMAALSRYLTRFRWSGDTLRLLTLASGTVLLGLSVRWWVPGLTSLGIGAILTAASGILSLRGIASRLGADHRLVRLVCRIPGGRLACGT